MKPNIIYLHGFASSPRSTKAQYFAERFAMEKEISLKIPDLNVPSFNTLTLTAMLNHLRDVVRACPPGPVYLIGSSLGGLTAVHFANHFKNSEARRVEQLVLLAPALDFVANRRQKLGEDVFSAWENTGAMTVHNYATDSNRKIRYGLIEDIEHYNSYEVGLRIPILIFHGKNDESVPVEQSERFAETRSSVDLRVLDSDHSLLNQIDLIWQDMVSFLAL